MNNFINITIRRILNRLKITYTDVILVPPYQVSLLFNKRSGIYKGNKRDKRIIISLTSFPKRYSVLPICLESLLTQKVKPDMIVLWLHKDDVKLLPKKVHDLEKRGVTIKEINEDLKSYNKLYYSLKEYKNSCIITCDDDTLYSSWFVEKLYNKWLKHPECIVAYRGYDMIKTGEREFAPYNSWPFSSKTEPSLEIFGTGVGGVLYPPDCMHEAFWDTNLIKTLSPGTDDIWFKACSLMKSVKTVIIKKGFKEFPIIHYRNSQKTALWQDNVSLQKNDLNMKRVFDHFNLYEKIK